MKIKKNISYYSLFIFMAFCLNSYCANNQSKEINFFAQALYQIIYSSTESERAGFAPPDYSVKDRDHEFDSLDSQLDRLKSESQIQIVPTQHRWDKNLTVTMNMPLFGKVIFSSATDESGAKGMQVEVPQTGKKVSLGPFIIEKGLFQIINGKISYGAQVSLFGKKARIGLKEFKFEEGGLERFETALLQGDTKALKNISIMSMTFGLSFEDDAVTLDLGGGNSLKLTDMDLVISQKDGLYFRQSGEILNQKFDLIGGIDFTTKEFRFKGEIKKRSIIDIIPQFKDSFIQDLFIEGAFSFSKKTGLVVEGSLTGEGDAGIEIQGIKLKEAKIDIKTSEKYAVISGKTEILGLPLNAYFSAFFGERKGLQLSVEVPTGVKDWKPFAQIPLKELQDITLNEIRVVGEAQYIAASKGSKKKNELKKTGSDSVDMGDIGDEGLKFAFYVAGRSTILNTKSEVVVKVDKMKGKGFGGSLIAGLPEGWKLSRSFPDLFKNKNVLTDALDMIQLDSARFVLSTRQDVIAGQSVDPGFNLFARASMDTTQDNIVLKALDTIFIKAEDRGGSLAVSGSFNPISLKTLSLKLGVATGGFGFKAGPAQFYDGTLGIVVRGEPSIGLEGMFKFKPTPESDPLDFALDLTFGPVDFGIAGSMKNVWKNPFGVQGFEFGNLGLQGRQTYSAIQEAVAAAGGTAGVGALWILVPAQFGVTGEVKIGKDPKALEALATMNLGKNITSLALEAKIKNPVTLPELVEIILNEMKVESDLLSAFNTMIPVKLKQASLKFVPLGANIGNIKVHMGIGGSFYLEILNKDTHVDFNLSSQGLTAKGRFPGFEIGPLKMSDYDGTGDPHLDIQFNVKEQKFEIDGLMKIGDLLQSKTKWYLTKKGTGFATETFVGPDNMKIGLKMKGTTVPFDDLSELAKLNPEDITLEVDFDDTFTQKVRDDVIVRLKGAKKDLEREVNEVIEQIARKSLKKDIEKQEKRVEEARSKRVYFVDNPLESIRREKDVRVEEIKLSGLKLKYHLERTEVGKVLTKTARKLGLDALAQKVLMEFKRLGIDILEKGEAVFKDVSRLAFIKKLHWKGSLADFAHDKLPGIEVTVCAGCQEIKKTIPVFDIRNPAQSVDSIVQSIITGTKDIVIATFNGDKCERVCGAPA